MNKNWIWNPKTKGSGILTCIPQTGICPNNCEDCFFQGGRSYLEPLSKNLPDHDDAPFLEVAIGGEVEYLVTGNKAHYPRKSREGIKIFSPTEFINFYRKIKVKRSGVIS